MPDILRPHLCFMDAASDEYCSGASADSAWWFKLGEHHSNAIFKLAAKANNQEMSAMRRGQVYFSIY